MAKLYIDGYIGEMDFSLRLLNKFLSENEGATEIDVYINSGGGSVTEGFAIYDRLMAIDAKVNTIVNGMCGSIATVIYQAGKKGTRSMYPNSEFFVHNPNWTPMYPEAMEAKDVQALAEDLKAAETKLLNFYISITGKEESELKPILDRQTTLTANEAIQWGFVDEVKTTEIKAFTKYQIAAYFNNSINKNNSEMNTEVQAELGSIKKFLTNISKKLFKNAVATTSESVTVYFDGETIEVGTALFVDEAMTEAAPDGEHTIEGVTYVVAEGVVTEVMEVAPDESEALKAENEALKAQLAELTASVEANNELKADFVALKKQFSALVVNVEGAKGGQSFKGQEATEKKDWKQMALEARAAKKK